MIEYKSENRIPQIQWRHQDNLFDQCNIHCIIGSVIRKKVHFLPKKIAGRLNNPAIFVPKGGLEPPPGINRTGF